jgi:hypothetical protein
MWYGDGNWLCMPDIIVCWIWNSVVFSGMAPLQQSRLEYLYYACVMAAPLNDPWGIDTSASAAILYFLSRARPKSTLFSCSPAASILSQYTCHPEWSLLFHPLDRIKSLRAAG